MVDNNNFKKLNFKHFQVVTEKFDDNHYTVLFYLGIPVLDLRLGSDWKFCELGEEYRTMNSLKRKHLFWKEYEGVILEALNEQDPCLFKSKDVTERTLSREELLDRDTWEW